MTYQPQTKVTTAIATHNQAAGAHNIFIGADIPAGTELDDWTAQYASLLTGPSGQMWLRRATTAEVPQNPPPVQSTVSEQLDLGQQHFAVTYINPSSGGLGATGNAGASATSQEMADAMTQAVLKLDQAAYDKLLARLQTDYRRGRAGSGQTTALELHASNVNGATVTSYVADATAELTMVGAVIDAWNRWNRISDRDIASKMASDIEAYLFIEDEGRSYLVADTTQKNHHVFNSSSYSKMGVPNPVIYRMLKTFTGKPIWDRAIEGCYDYLTKCTQGAMTTTSGLPPDWAWYETAGHSVRPIVNGQEGSTETLTTNYGSRARRFVQNIAADLRTFGEARATSFLTGAIRTFYNNAWTTNSRIVDAYSHVGAEVIGNENASAYRVAIEVLTANSTTSAAATAMTTNKLVNGMIQVGDERYIPDQIQGQTPSSIRARDLSVWFIAAVNAGLYNDLAFLGSNPNAGTNPPASGGGTTDPDPPPVVVPPGDTNPPSTGTEKLIADPGSQIMGWYNSLPTSTKKTRVGYAANRPSGLWVGINWDPVWSGANTFINYCEANDAVATVLLYSIPLRDVGQYSAGGAQDDEEYHEHVEIGAEVIGDRVVKLVYEPDSLTHLSELTQVQQSGRLSNMRWAIQYLKANCPNLTLLVDVGHPQWKSRTDAADLLRRVGVEHADGWAQNVSNFVSFEENVSYGNDIYALLNMPNKGYTIDCGRNGSPIQAPHWANPPRRRYGRSAQWGGFAPQFPHLFGVCDWKKPGESDGNSGDGAPSAGALWQTYIWNDSVGDNVDTSLVSTSSGLAQRPPVPGVAIVAPT